MSIRVYTLCDGAGGLHLLDVMQYLAPGCNLDAFIQSFSNTGSGNSDNEDNNKSYFPYENIDSYDKLAEK